MLRRRRRPPALKGASAPLPWYQRLLKAFLDLPPGLLNRLAGGPARVDGQSLDPRLAPLCRWVARRPDTSELSVPRARAEMARKTHLLGGPRLLMDRVDEHTLPADREGVGEEGAVGRDRPRITLRVYSPPTLLPDPPGLVYFHGGGWVVGDLQSHDTLCSILASQTPCRVIAVDYRLAPESPFPAAVDDALAAFRWVSENAESLGVDRRRIAVGGDSAGGNLATAVCLEQARAGAEVPAGQLLLYPVTDTDLDTESYRLFANGFGLSRATMNWFFEHYAGPARDGDGDGNGDVDPRLAPLRADDLSGLPPAIVATAGFDVLRDEGRAYADRLEQAGVEVVRRHYGALIHGFANICLVDPCRQALDELINDLAYLFHRLAARRRTDRP